MRWLEITGTLVGLLYLYFEYRASIWLWLASVVMPLIYIFVYHSAGFYADMAINVYYLGASLYGWALWLGGGRKRSAGQGPRPITRAPLRIAAPLAAVFLLCFAAIAYVLVRFTDSTVPYGDSFTTALSVVGLWMLAQKYAEQWLVWLVVDVACCALYIYKGLYPTAALYGLYSVIAVLGYRKWLRMIDEGKDDETLPAPR